METTRQEVGADTLVFLSPQCPQLTPELEVDALRAVLLLFSFGVFSDSDQLPCYLSFWGSERRGVTKGLRGGGAGFDWFFGFGE